MFLKKKLITIDVTSVEDIEEALSKSDKVRLELTEDLTLTSPIEIAEGKEVNFKLDSDITCEKESFLVKNAVLTLSGEGTIHSTTRKSNAAITIEGENAVININGITIDTVGDESPTGNYAYGVYLKDGATAKFSSGTIKVGQSSCISSNNTTGGSSIDVTGGELLSDGSYALYIPAQGNINISGGTVQGINARMGKIKISGDAKIIPTTITADTQDDLGHNFNTSGCIWFGDTIALVVGTYADTEGTDLVLDISGNAKVKSNFQSAIAIYDIDTKEAQNVLVNVADSTKVTTTDPNFDMIKVYDHQAVADAASAAGKTYEAVADSDITVKVDREVVYPENV